MRIVLKHLGYLLLIFSIFLTLPLIYSLIINETFMPYLAPLMITAGLGTLIVTKKSDENIGVTSLDIPNSITLSALTFLTIAIVGAIPFIMHGGYSPLDATFESFSGFTTTGLTIIDDVESVPNSLLLWRAETQWIGGLGIIILFLVIVSAMRKQDSLKKTTTKARAIATLYQAQGASEKLEANMRKSIRRTLMIYTTYTLIGIFLLWLTGLTLFESVAIAFTAISTAGFSVTNQFYTNWSTLLVISGLILAGATSFVVHNKLFRRQFKEIIKTKTFMFYLGYIFIALIIMFAIIKDFKIAFFEVLTSFTTTGYTITNVALLPQIAIMIIMVGMLIGGMIGSTSGGLKINRIILTLKSIALMVKKNTSPRGAILPLKMEGKTVEDGTISVMYTYIACYILILFLGTFVLLLTGIDFKDSSFQIFSALGGVGLSTTQISGFNAIAKIVLIIAMLFGRLEIFPVLVMGKMSYDHIRKTIRSKKEESRKHFYMRWIPAYLWKKEKLTQKKLNIQKEMNLQQKNNSKNISKQEKSQVRP